ncbi:hypothetical protein OROMI_019094 [Orobanche minor]
MMGGDDYRNPIDGRSFERTHGLCLDFHRGGGFFGSGETTTLDAGWRLRDLGKETSGRWRPEILADLSGVRWLRLGISGFKRHGGNDSRQKKVRLLSHGLPESGLGSIVGSTKGRQWIWMSDNGSVPSPPMKDSDHLFGPSEIGPKFAYEAGIRRKIISNNDMFPEWAGYIRRLRACELEEGGSLCNHILEMMNYMNRLEYLDTNFDRNLAVPLLLRSLPDSYNDFLWKNHCENKSKTWIEIINELRRYEEDKITQKGKLEEEKGKEKRKEKHYALDAQEGSSKRRKSCFWRDLGNGERKCPKNIEESIGSSS